MGKAFQGEKIACAKGLWSEGTWHVGGTSEALVWLKEVSEGAVVKGKIIKGHVRSVCSLFIYLLISGSAGSLLLHSGFSLVVVSGGYSLVAVLGLLIVVVSLVGEHGL